MRRILKNPWTWIFALPALVFVILVSVHAPVDTMLLTFGFLLFLAIALPASKYVLRAPVLVYQGDVSSEALNITGWACVMLSLESTQVYRWVYITMDRPAWLTETYWSSSFIYAMFYGFLLVAWSTRRAVPKPPNGRVGLGGFFIGFATAIGLMLSGILPSVTRTVVVLFGSLTHAF